MFDSLRSAWLRVGRWPRLLAAATCLLLAALSALGAARDRAAARTAPRTVSVVVTTRALAAGRVLRAGDVRVEHWPANLHPPPAARAVGAVVGRRCAGALSANEPLTPPRLLGAGIATGLAAGLGAVPIDVADGRSAEYVRAGDHVDVLAGPSDSSVDGAGSVDAGSVDAGSVGAGSVGAGSVGAGSVGGGSGGGGSGGGGSGGGGSVGAGSVGAELVAGDAAVLSVLPGRDGAGSVVVIAANRPTALRIARQQATRAFTVVVLPP